MWLILKLNRLFAYCFNSRYIFNCNERVYNHQGLRTAKGVGAC